MYYLIKFHDVYMKRFLSFSKNYLIFCSVSSKKKILLLIKHEANQNWPKPPTTSQNHPKLPTTSQNQLKPAKTTQNHPQPVKTTFSLPKLTKTNKTTPKESIKTMHTYLSSTEKPYYF